MRRVKNSKKVSTAILTGILAVTLSVCALAAPGNGNRMGGGREAQGAFAEGERPELPEMNEGERPELPQMNEGDRPELPEMNEGERPELPEGEAPDGQQAPPMGRGQKGGMIDPEAVAEAISSIEDEETQSTLSGLLAAYESAREAEREAFDALREGDGSSEGETDLDSLRTAAREAEEALIAALRENGITVEMKAPMPMGSDQKPSAETSCDTDTAGNTEGSRTETGFFTRIRNAASDFFGKFTKG
ncbi:MAG: hypothetical protein K6G83_03740 [Lachnospiraceae bacterium]|nr:hypothetical protein [Lachnospiraceae bacterium]